MTDVSDLRRAVLDGFAAGIAAADPAAAVARALTANPIPRAKGRQIVIAVGKAACAMVQAARGHLPDVDMAECLAVTNYENAQPVEGCTVLAAGHPVPDANGLAASEAVIALLSGAGAADCVLFLVSGGGSALLPAPVPGLSLADKQAVNAVLLAGGLDIYATNLVRQGLSRLKGGGLARIAAPARVRTLAISDVIGDDPRAIASGPTASPLGTRAAAARMLRERGLWDRLPSSAQAILDGPEAGAGAATGDVEVIASNRSSLQAVAAALAPWRPQVVTDRLSGDVAMVARDLARQAAGLRGARALVWGGEPTVTLAGNGKGGRNQELALRFCSEFQTTGDDWVFLSGGTDGRDGPTDAAGGIVDAGTLARARATGLDPVAALARNDSYQVLKAAGDLLVTGTTGTNVADIMVFLRGQGA